MMENAIEILATENRINTLRGRSSKDNGKIVKKLQRKLRRLREVR